MADQSDVEAVLVGLISAALYPNGPGLPSAVDATCRVYRGWPVASALDADLASGVVNVSVFPTPGSSHDTTRWGRDVLTIQTNPTLAVSVQGNTVAFTGNAGVGQLAGILVDGQAYVHRTVVNDTPASVASALVAQIATNRPSTASGTEVIIPGALSIVARTVADGMFHEELRRQMQSFRITAWCPGPDLRDQVCALLDAAIASTEFVTLPDGFAAWIRYAGTSTFDEDQKAGLYRRDLLYTVEYPTTLSHIQPAMLFGTFVSQGAAILS